MAEVDSIVATAFARATAAAEALADEMAPPPGVDAPDAKALDHIADMARQYARGPIGTMTVLGNLLAPALPNIKVMGH